MKISNIITCAIVFVFALLALIVPGKVLDFMVVIIGIEALLNGLYGIFYVRRLAPIPDFQYTILIRSMISIIIAILVIVFPRAFANITYRIMMWVVAFYLIVGSLIQFYAIGKLRDTDIKRKQFVVENIASIIIAVVMFVIFYNPETTIRIIGGVILALDVIYFAIEFINRPIIDNKVEVIDDVQ